MRDALPRLVPGVPVAALTDVLTAALGRDLVGLYAYGSVVSGGFDAGVSDLDLVAVTARDAAHLDLDALDHAHTRFIADHPDWQDRLEVVYIGQATLREFRASSVDLAVISPGEPFHLTGPVRDWSQNWYLARSSGVTLAGKAAKDVFPEITLGEYVAAVSAYAAWLTARDLQDESPGMVAYTILSLCRALRTLQSGQPCTKQEGAAWVAGLEPTWASLIDAALACRLSRGATGFRDPESRAAAAHFVQTVAGTGSWRHLGG